MKCGGIKRESLIYLGSNYLKSLKIKKINKQKIIF